MEEDIVSNVRDLLVTAAVDYEQATRVEGSSSAGGASSSSTPELRAAISAVRDLYEIFRNSDSAIPEMKELWGDLGLENVSLGSLVGMFTLLMEKGGILALRAAICYTCLFLIPDCPVFSLFSEVAFQALVSCLRKSSRLNFKGGKEAVENTRDAGDKRKKGPKKGKRAREREEPAPGSDEAEVEPGDVTKGEAVHVPKVEEIYPVILNLRLALGVISLKNHQETLRLLLQLLVEMLHLLGGIEDDDRLNHGGGRANSRKRFIPATPRSRASVPTIVFATLKDLLSEIHGSPVETAALLLRSLTPTMLLNHAGGSSVHGGEIRLAALQFVLKHFLGGQRSDLRPAVVALSRYLCFKAPEKTDARQHAVDSVMILLKVFKARERSKFANFVWKLSHSKPRHRLIAVDLSLALLGGLSNPFISEDDTDAANLASPYGSPGIVGVKRPRNCSGKSRDDTGVENGARENEIGRTSDEVEGGNISEGGSDTNGNVGNCNEALHENQPWGIKCLEILLHRCSDKVAQIRARSLTNLAQVLELLSSDVSSRHDLQNLLGFSGSANCGLGTAASKFLNPNGVSFCSTDQCATPTIGGLTPSPEPGASGPTASPLTPGAGHRDIWSLLARRCVDEKAVVRKAALILMKKSASLLGRVPDDGIINALGAACGDSLISVRKVALAALSEVMRRFPGDSRVGSEWLKSGLPLAFDNESTLQEDCLSLFEELVLDRISSISALKFPKNTSGVTPAGQNEILRLLPKGVLGLLKGIADGGSVSSCVKRICLCLGRKKRVRPSIAIALQKLITAFQIVPSKRTTSQVQAHIFPHGAWFLLSEVSAFVPKAVGWEFLRTHWQLLDNKGTRNRSTPKVSALIHEETPLQEGMLRSDRQMEDLAAWAADRVHLLQTISNVAMELPPDAAADLCSEILERLRLFNMHPAEVGAHVKALANLCRQKATSLQQGDELVAVWVKELLEKAEIVLQTFVSTSLTGGHISRDEPEIGIQTPNMSTQRRSSKKHRASQSKQSMNADGRSSKTGKASDQIVTVISTVGALIMICPGMSLGHVVPLLQALVSRETILLKPRMRNVHGIQEPMTTEVNVHVWVTLGKLCLANDALAKRCIPLFIQELEWSDSAAVRNNIMVAMTDFCVRYTALVDGYIHIFTKSLRDPCELVRRQTFVLLARLLQRDYVKWRGVLFHRFLLALVDDSEKICQLARYLFNNILKLKAPLLAYNSFVESIFVLNDCHKHASSSTVLQSSANGGSLFSLRGTAPQVVQKRMHIYTALLQQMVPEHLLATFAKLCAEILAAAADGFLDLNDGPSQSVLQDALRILASKELRITSSRTASGAAEFEEEEGSAAEAMAAVKGRVVTQLMKKNLVQNAIPIFIELKRLLESKNSPMLGLLMECMRVMLKDYKSEIEEILVADRQLQKEILYDIQKHEAAKARAKVSGATQMQQGTEGNENCDQTPVARRVPAKSGTLEGLIGSGGIALRNRKDLNGTISRDMENVHHNVIDLRAHLHSKPRSAQPKTPAHSIMRKSPLGDSVPSVATAGLLGPSPRVTWLDHTPRLVQRSGTSRLGSNVASPVISNLGRRRETDVPLPIDRNDNLDCPSVGGASKFQAPSARDFVSDDPCLAQAVADVSASATVAIVLQQVACQVITPLRAMSVPKLCHPVSGPRVDSSSHEQHHSFETIVSKGAEDSLESTGLEAVRRRHCFSSIDEPCGNPP